VKVSDEEYEPLSVTKLGVFTQWENVAKSNDGDNRKLVKRGDFVINSRSDRKGSSGVSDRDGSVSLINIVLQPRKTIIAGYTNYLLKSYQFIEEYYRNGRGIVADLWTTRFEEMKMIKVAIPSIKEQEAIANYLDTATSKIDEAIAQQQKMIDLLNERKQIIINNAVSKGLDPNVKMKPSGIDWIGDIPKHWEVRKIKTIVEKVGSGITPRGGGSVYVDEGVMLLRSQNVYFEGFKLNDVAHITDAIDKNMSNTRVKEGDVLLNITGGSIGRCYFVPNGFPRANVNQHVCIVRPLNFSTKYLYYLLRSKCCQVQVDLQQTGGNREGLTSSAIKNFVIPIPPVNEQNAIIEYLDVRDKDLQSSIEICNKQISLLQERKQIIINDVVTGKVKVI
jgi:type I restriction enzyme S subunit